VTSGEQESRRNTYLRGLCALCGEPREEDRTHTARFQLADQVKTARKTCGEMGGDLLEKKSSVISPQLSVKAARIFGCH
jgi:hypothetical protein